MIAGIDHIAVAVPDLAQAIAKIVNDFGLALTGVETVPTAHTETAFFDIERCKLELITPLDGSGPVAKYLSTRQGGLHHICFRSDSLLDDMAELRSRGYSFLSDEPMVGAHNTRVVFIHPRCCYGVLVELSQYL